VVKRHADSTHLAAGHSGISADTIRIGPKKQPKWSNLVGHWRYQQNHTGALTCGAGTQGGLDMFTVASTSQLFTSSGTAYSGSQNHTALEQMNPFKTTTGSSVLSSTATAAADRFMLRSVSVKFEVTNFSAIGAIVDVYVCTPKIATSQTLLSAWDNADDAFGLAVAAFPAGGAAVSGALSGNNRLIPYVVPHDNSRFRAQWRIVATKAIRLEGNSTELLSVDIGWNKIIQKNKYTGVQQFIPGVTYGFLIVYKGALVLDTTGATHYPTTGSVSIGFGSTSRYVMSAVKDNAGRLDAQALVTKFNTPAGAAQALIDADDSPTNQAAVTVV